MVKLLDVVQPSHGLLGTQLVLCHSVLDQHSQLFTKDTHPESSHVSVVGERNTEKKTTNPPDLNLVWVTFSSSVV